MKNRSFRLLFAVLVACPIQAVASRVPTCEAPPSFVDAKNYEGVDFSQLPEQVYVARSVEIWAANRDKGLRLFGIHNFKTMKSDVRCSKPPMQGSVNLQAWVPALLDLSKEKAWGDSVWQTQILLESGRVGIWSQKTHLAPPETVRKIAQQGTWRSIEGESYELIWEEVHDGTQLYFRLVFDILN